MDFVISESITRKAETNEQGFLEVIKVSSSQIDCINCRACGEEYSQDDFTGIIYE
jgi:hypothetical protein